MDVRTRDVHGSKLHRKPFIQESLDPIRQRNGPKYNRSTEKLAVQRAISVILSDYIELFQQFTRDAGFREKLTSFVLTVANDRAQVQL